MAREICGVVIDAQKLEVKFEETKNLRGQK